MLMPSVGGLPQEPREDIAAPERKKAGTKGVVIKERRWFFLRTPTIQSVIEDQSNVDMYNFEEDAALTIWENHEETRKMWN